MPTVGGKTFGYTDQDIAAAEQYATETGMDIEYEEGAGETGMYRKIRKSGTTLYRMKGNPMKRNFGIPSPLKDDEWVDAGRGARTNLHKGDAKIKRGEKGHIHSTSYIKAYEPRKLGGEIGERGPAKPPTKEMILKHEKLSKLAKKPK